MIMNFKDSKFGKYDGGYEGFKTVVINFDPLKRFNLLTLFNINFFCILAKLL